MDIFSYGIAGKERKTQLYFRDDNKFSFIKRDLLYSCLVERSGDTLKKAWKHFYCNQLFFPGYKKISADAITLGFVRDIILDPFNKIPTGEETTEKPKDNKGSLKSWIAKVATNQRHIFQTKRQQNSKEDIVNWVLVGVIVIQVLGWLAGFLT